MNVINQCVSNECWIAKCYEEMFESRESDMTVYVNKQVNLNPSFKVMPKKVAIIFESSGSQHLVKVSIIQNNHCR